MPKSDHVLVLTIWSFDDALIQTYTLPYVRIIRKQIASSRKIFLVTLEKENLTPERELAIRSELEPQGILWKSFSYRPMNAWAMVRWTWVFMRLLFLVARERIFTIHCWCTPAGAIGYGICVALNRRLVLDSYEPHAEAMIENGTWSKGSIIYRLLFWLERKQTERADQVIGTTEGMREYALTKYGATIKNFSVKPACVDLTQFDREKSYDQALANELGLLDKIVCVYAGKLGGIYLDKEVFDFVRVARDYWGEKFRFLLMTNHRADEIDKWMREVGLEPRFVIVRFVPHAQMSAYLSLGSFALTPVKPVPTKAYCTPIKNGEYWALGLPVVIPDHISVDSEIIGNQKIGAVLTALDRMNYQKAVHEIEERINTLGMAEKIRGIARRYRSLSIAEEVYQQVYSKT